MSSTSSKSGGDGRGREPERGPAAQVFFRRAGRSIRAYRAVPLGDVELPEDIRERESFSPLFSWEILSGKETVFRGTGHDPTGMHAEALQQEPGPKADSRGGVSPPSTRLERRDTSEEVAYFWMTLPVLEGAKRIRLYSFAMSAVYGFPPTEAAADVKFPEVRRNAQRKRGSGKRTDTLQEKSPHRG